MNLDPHLTIEQLDDQISNLRATLFDLSQENNENGTYDFAQLHQKRILEREVHHKRTLLHFLLQDQPQPFHFYRMPPEMQVEICQWISAPQDQLYLLQMFPSLGPLMHWDEGTLYFTLIYPLIKRYLQQDWRDLWGLCQVSPAFMEVVLSHFHLDLWSDKNWLPWTSVVPVYEMNSDAAERNLISTCDQLGRAPWMNNMAFPCAISSWLFAHGVQIPDFVTQFLTAHGEKVWGLKIYVNLGDNNPHVSLPILHRLLAATPNLIHLELWTTAWNWGMDHQPLPNNFPELPQLRYLDSVGPFTVSLAEKYAPTLKSLQSSWTEPDPFSINVHPAQLENYRVFHHPTLDNGFPESILMCPLRVIHVALVVVTNGINLPGLLETLSHFQFTLEKLEIRNFLGMMHGTDPALLAADKRWMLRVKLPKLRVLQVTNYRGKLDWLILFPSLNTLILRDYSTGLTWERQKSPDKLYFPTSPQTRFSTNAWAYLHNLKEIRVQNAEQKFVVSREEHARYLKIRNGGFWARLRSLLPFRLNSS